MTGQVLQWQSLHGWAPDEGQWAVLWPGYYGHFTACWVNGQWGYCRPSDLVNATVGASLEVPHLATEAVPYVDRGGLP
jgi:hypothetical protein